MIKVDSVLRKSAFAAAVAASMFVTVGSAQAGTFGTDVTTAIDRGIEWLANSGAFNNPSNAGDAHGLPMLALLEKRASGIPTDPPQGYNGASATDQARLRTAAAYILDRVNETALYTYRDGAMLMALSSYALTGGPDKSVLAPGNADYQTIKQAMDALTDRALNGQQRAANGYVNPIDQGYWCYSGPGCKDSSTTQFMAAGLSAARTFYASNKSADDPFNDAARVAAIDAALALTKTAYELNAYTGSDNGNCFVLTATERGHGYNSQFGSVGGYRPSLQQTASGIYIQQFGGANLNSPSVQQYMQWVNNRYRWQDLDNLGNSWSGNSYWYYLWSSFKGMELLRQAGTAPAPGNLSPDSYGKLPAANAPACVVRQENKDPAAVARPASFGAGGVGAYAGETKGQYFDYAHQILSHQCYDGTLPINGSDGRFACNGAPGRWDNYASQAYALLVLQRSTGVIIERCDVTGDGKIDITDIGLIRAAIGTTPGVNDVRDYTQDGKITINDVRACTLKCTKPKCAP